MQASGRNISVVCYCSDGRAHCCASRISAARTRAPTPWPTPYHCKCRGVTILTPFVEFWQRSLYHARIAFLREATTIMKIDVRFFISSLIGLKFCTHLEGGNMQHHGVTIFKFPPLKSLAPLWILRLHYGQWDEQFQIDISKLISKISSPYFHTY